MNLFENFENSMMYKILGSDDSPETIKQRLLLLDEPSYETIKKVCWRLKFIEQLENANIEHTNEYLNYLDRLRLYLSATCIDILTHENYQSFIEWIKKSANEDSVKAKLEQMISEITNKSNNQDAQKIVLDWLERFHKEDYNPKMSIRQAFRRFISEAPRWLQDWITNTYRIEFDQKNAIRWDSLGQVEKCERIGEYLYNTRNIFTHRATPYYPLDYTRRTTAVSGIKGYAGTKIPGNDDMFFDVALPSEISECDTIKLLLISWIRRNKLNIDDDVSFAEKFWAIR